LLPPLKIKAYCLYNHKYAFCVNSILILLHLRKVPNSA
jgi:hypothetical protein